jgi:hypothetical protein
VASGSRLFSEPHPTLKRELDAPPLTLDFPALPDQWRRTLLVFRCQRPPGLEEGPWLAMALRGAWGRQLLTMAVAAVGGDNAADPFGRAQAVEVFFRTQAHVTRQLAVSKPFVIRVIFGPRLLTVQLTLFGFAGFWRPQARDAMLAALAQGLPLREGGRLRVPYPVVDCHWGRAETVAVPEPAAEVLVRLRSPLCLRAALPIENNLDDFAMSLVNRLSGLARWQGVRIETDWSGWRDLAKALRITIVESGAYATRRFSTAQPGRAMPYAGVLGAFTIAGPLAPLMPLLALGETAHAGARTAFGFGAYDLLVG